MTAALQGHWLGCPCTEFVDYHGIKYCRVCGLKDAPAVHAATTIVETTRPTVAQTNGEPLTGNPLEEDSPI